MSEDEALMTALRGVAARADPVPAEALLRARSAIAYRRLDAALAALTEDSSDSDKALTGVRSATARARLLAFEADDAAIEVEVTPHGERRLLVGQCIPPAAAQVTVTQGEHTVTVETDELGRFRLEAARGPMSLRCHWAQGRADIVTSWVVL